MGTSRLFMSLLRSLAGWEMDFAINMSRLTALQRRLFNKASESLCSGRHVAQSATTIDDYSWHLPRDGIHRCALWKKL